jgi:hypothetical protein
MTSWKYRGEEIVVTAALPKWAPLKKVEQIDTSTAIKITPLPWWLDRHR